MDFSFLTAIHGNQRWVTCWMLYVREGQTQYGTSDLLHTLVFGRLLASMLASYRP